MTIIIPEPEDFQPYPVGTRAQRHNTKAFINSDPSQIVLHRKEKIFLSDGGFKWSLAVPQPLQIMRLIPSQDAMPEVQTPDGVTLTPSYVLLGEWDCNMKRWDLFTLHEVHYQIVGPIRPLHTDYPYEKKGDVAQI